MSETHERMGKFHIFKFMNICIPDEYWTGENTVKYQIPYLTPSSIYRLDELLKPSFVVMEFGAGGSTLFFAKRCMKVISVESSQNWIHSLTNEAKTLNLGNVQFYNYTKKELLFEFLKTIENNSLDVLLIDTDDYGYTDLDCDNISAQTESRSRDILTELALPKLKQSGIYILDNYDRPWYKTSMDTEVWTVEKYDDPHWEGKGTLLAYRKNV